MVANFKPTRDGVFTVVGTGDATIDTPRLAAAVAAANAYFVAYGRPATLIFDREVHFTGQHVFTSPTGLECTGGSWLVRSDTSAMISYNAIQYQSQANGGPIQYSEIPFVEIQDVSAGEGVINVPQSYNLASREWVIVYGFSQIADTTPHSGTNQAYPMEIQRINRRTSTACANGFCGYVFDDFLDDSYLTATIGGVSRAPRLAAMRGNFKMLQGIRIRNFNYKMKESQFSASTSPTPFAAPLYFERCFDVEMYNCNFGYPHPGHANFRYCANVRRHGCKWDSLENFSYDSEEGIVYGFWDAICNGVDIQHCTFGGMRHAYTTGGAAATSIHGGGSNRVGAVKSVLIHGNRFGNNGRLSGTTLSGISILNLHEEGRRVTISDNTFYVPGEQNVQNRGLTIRFRDAVVRNNSFFCGPAATPIAIYGARATISNNTFNGGLRCELSTSPGAPAFAEINKVRFTNNTFRNFVTPAIWINTGSDHEILGNTFDNCGYQLVTGFKKAAIEVANLKPGGTVRIQDNSINKYANDFSVHTGSLQASQVFLDGNVCQGYGNLSLGLDRSLANTAEIEMRSLGRNNGMPNAVVVQQTAHGLAASSIGRPLNTSHGLYNDTVSGQVCAGVLADVIDANHYIMYAASDSFILPTSLMATGYLFPAGGRDAYWDQGQLRYVGTKPVASVAAAVPVLRLHASKPSGLMASVAIPQATASAPVTSYDFESIGLSVSDETTNLTTGTAKLTFRMPHGMLVQSVRASLTTAATGSTVIVDINADGATILGTKLSIDAGETTSTTAASASTLVTTFLSDDTLMTIDIDQVGSTLPGKGLKVWLLGVRA